jgi:hypothetical protein
MRCLLLPKSVIKTLGLAWPHVPCTFCQLEGDVLLLVINPACAYTGEIPTKAAFPWAALYTTVTVS